MNSDRMQHAADEPGHSREAQHADTPPMQSGMKRAGVSHAPGMAMGTVVWPHFANMIVGVWLITSIFAFDYGSEALRVSDVVSGSLVILLAALSVSRWKRFQFWAPWASSLVGLWLLFAPLVFWAPTPTPYANDTLLGVLVVTFSILAPGMPGMAGMDMAAGPDLPPGWSYNPSTWPQRAPIIALALVGFFLSREMTAFQLKHITSFTDPFFGSGTQRVLTSTVSRAFPIPDAGLGAVAYAVEFLMGFMGDTRRWRTMPWMVTFFGILVVPLGIVSITLIILQPLAVGAWCTPCLTAATAMLIMVALTLDEVVATLMFLVQARREGQPLWPIFWRGGTLAVAGARPVRVRQNVVSPGAMVWGISLPWNLLASVALGIWLMLAPARFASIAPAAHSDHLVGALVVTVAVIALADVGRTVRFVNVLFGLWLMLSSWVLAGATAASRWNDVVAGGLVLFLSLPRGKIGESYGEFDRYIK